MAFNHLELPGGRHSDLNGFPIGLDQRSGTRFVGQASQKLSGDALPRDMYYVIRTGSLHSLHSSCRRDAIATWEVNCCHLLSKNPIVCASYTLDSTDSWSPAVGRSDVTTCHPCGDLKPA